MSDKGDDKYAKAKKERQKSVLAILTSPENKKIVVAGPGTGKTYLFKAILEGKKKALTLTFVNSLVEDLSLELCGLSDVKTLHSFARSVISRAKKEVKIFPKLSEVIKEDAKVLLGEEIDFDAIFHDRDDGNVHIDFYRKRKDYYDHYGYADLVFAAVKYLENKPDRVPAYEQILVDEFQDFNKLEVSLIDALAAKSPVLLAGDDDQALYAFKKASADHIRGRHSDGDSEYKAFSLPFCSRSTRVIVEAINDLLGAASTNGFLKNRITKEYKYFDDEKKDKESDKYPTIFYTQVFSKQIPWFIGSQIAKIAEEARKTFSVLIISPTKTQCRMIAGALRKKGFENVAFHDKQGEKDPTLLDGLKLLLEDDKSNLGWRIAGKSLLSEKVYKKLIADSAGDNEQPIGELVDKECKRKVKGFLKTLRAVKNGKEVGESELATILAGTEFNPHEMAKDALAAELAESKRLENAGIRKIPIKVSTIQSSKGLAEEHVFITHFDNQFFGGSEKRKLTDQDICNFLVSMTRARKRVFLISSKQEDPTLLNWIRPERIERL
jgi:superfamily I DNA/RNA helicase